MKTRIYNLIILDESGSMAGAWNATISGCNETINIIKSSAEKFADTQEQLMSIYAFQSGGTPSRYLVKNVPAAAAEHITKSDYKPWGGTPLLDAVGSTLIDLKATVEAHENAVGSVTIITDGAENSSTDYTWQQVANLINRLKEQGWSFNFIGANIDVAATAKKMSIDNHMEFQNTNEGTRQMFAKERMARESYYCRMEESAHDSGSKKSFAERMKDAARNYFG